MPLHVLSGVTTVTFSRRIMQKSGVLKNHWVYPRVELMRRGEGGEGGEGVVIGACVQSHGQVRVFESI